MTLAKLLREGVSILLAAVIIGLLYNSFSSAGIAMLYHPLDIPDKDNISVAAAFQLYQSGRVAFIDTRHSDQFSENYIPKSYNVPANWTIDQIAEFMQRFSPDQILVVYCSEPKCNFSVRVAGMLKFLKYSKIMLFRGGIKEWTDNSLPLIQEK